MGSNKPKPIISIKSCQDLDKSVSEPMAEYKPDNLIGRMFLLPPNQKGERHRASNKQNVIEVSQKLDADQETTAENINFLLDVGQGRSQAIISYNQVLDYMEKDNQDEETLFKFRAITGHQGPLDSDDPNSKGSLYNVMVKWETGEITEEPLSIIAADDPVTCGAYARKHNLINFPGCKRFIDIARNQKCLTRAVIQTRKRQVRRSATDQFGYQIPTTNMP